MAAKVISSSATISDVKRHFSEKPPEIFFRLPVCTGSAKVLVTDLTATVD
jgi:hypothetical protein